MSLNPKAMAWTPGPSSSGDRQGGRLGRIRKAVHCVGTSRNAGSRKVEPTREKRQAPGSLLQPEGRTWPGWSAGTRR